MAFSINSFGQTTLRSVDFETPNGYTVSVPEFSDGLYDFFCRTNGADSIGPNYSVTGQQGNIFFAAMDIDDGSTKPLIDTIFIEDVDISGQSNITFSMLVAEDDDLTNQDWDDNTYLIVKADIDNSGTYTTVFAVEAEGGINTVPRIDTDFDGVGDGSEITSVFQEFTANIAGSGSLLDIIIIFGNLDAGDEDIAIDNIVISATSDIEAPVATWLPDSGATGVAVGENITITFDEAIQNTDASEVTNANVGSLIALKETDIAGADVAFTATIDANKKVITIDPVLNLPYNQIIYVAVNAVEDVNGNESVKDSIRFTTMDVSAKTLALTEPVGGEKYYAGDDVTFTWNSANVANVYIAVFTPESGTWDTLFSNIPSDGSEAFTIPVNADYGDSYRVAITDAADIAVTDTSDFFTVVATPSISGIQQNNDGDASLLVGDVVRVEGIVTHVNGTKGYYIQDNYGAWNGIYVYDGTNTPSVQDSIIIEATVQEYFNATQLSNVVEYTNAGLGSAYPASEVLTTAELTEAYEGVLVSIINATVTNANAGNSMFEINDGSGALLVDDDLYRHSATQASHLTITGIGHYSYSAYKLLPREEGDVVSANDTITSIYTVNNTTNVISNVPFSHDLAAFEANINAPDSAVMDVFDADGITPATALDNTKLIKVLAADGITNRTYTININAELNNDSTLFSDVYTIENIAGTITDVPFGTELATFESNISPNFIAATFETYEVDGLTLAHDLQTDYKVIVTAENGATKTYTITIDAASNDSTISSTVYDVDNVVETITNVPFGSVLSVFESNLVPAVGATFETYEADGLTVAIDLQTGYKVIVTAQDNTAKKTYTVTVSEELKDLFFSEYVEGSSSNKALEIYNPNNVNVSLSSYIMRGTGNDSEDWEYIYTFPEGAEVLAGDVYVIVDDGAVVEMQNVADWVTPGFEVGFNGNDSRGLAKIVGVDTITVDVIGDSISATTANYDVAGVVGATADHTLIRKSTVRKANANWTMSAGTNATDSEWIVESLDNIANLGSHTVVPLSSDASLSRLDVNGSGLAGFNPSITEYAYELPYGTTEKPSVTVATNSQVATYEITPVADLAGTEAARTATIVVTAEDESTKTYTIVFTVAQASTDATLSDLKVDGETVTGFTSGTYNYEVQLSAGTTTTPTVTVTTTHANAQEDITAAADVNGSQAERTTTIVVTAEDGNTKLTYTVLFTVQTSSTESITNSNLYVYPTTVENNLYVVNTQNVNRVQVVNLTGAVSYEKECQGADKLELDLGELKSGVYVLRTISGNEITTHRFIKK